MEDINLALAAGIDIPIPECQIQIHQPTINEISYIGEKQYFTGLQLLCIQPNEETQNLKPFELFMTVINDKQAAKQKNIIIDVCKLLFPNHKVMLTPRTLLLNKNEENVIIDENNFSSLQETLRQIGCLAGKASESFNPADEAAAAIAKKLQRGRERVAAQKHAKENPNGASVLGQYMSILAIGLGMSMKDLTSLTVYQLYDLIERYSLYESFDLNIRQRLAGGKPDSQPDNWKKIIH